MQNYVVIQLVVLFLSLSVVAIGGSNSIMPELHIQTVDIHKWLSDGDFLQLFAIAQVAPGPNVLFATLIGWKVAGIAGAIGATIAMNAPSCLFSFTLARLSHRFSQKAAFKTLQAGLVPIALGLMLSSGYITARVIDNARLLAAVTSLVALLALQGRIHPIWLLGAGAMAGAAESYFL